MPLPKGVDQPVAADSKPARILVTDDVQEMRFVLRMIFEAEAFAVREAPDAATALELALGWPADAVLIDWHLGAEDGVSLVRRLRRSSFNGVIVMFSASTSSDLELRALAAGADDYLEKGSESSVVVATVQRLLQEARPFTRATATPPR